MITCNNGGRIVAHAGELPNLHGDILYADFETTSRDPKLDSLNPWHHCYPLGLAVAVDQSAPYYIPIGHQQGINLPLPVVTEWWRNTLSRVKAWCNHNPKYDAHVSTNGLGVAPDRDLPLVDTIVLSKLRDSDMQYQGGYSLDNLSSKWLGVDITQYEAAIKVYLPEGKHRQRCKDYGVIPIDVLGEYACQDIISTRDLGAYLQDWLATAPECQRVWDNEIRLTALLYRMEQRGICVDPHQLKQKEARLFRDMAQIEERLEKLIGRSIKPNSNDDCFDVLCNQHGLPVVAWTDSGNPSFDKYALEQYLGHPYAPHEIIKLLLEYRHKFTLYSYFVKPYMDQHIDGILHSTYNQTVRTGRMSCSEPNNMQLSKEAKELIHPRPGCAFWSCDASQIEFRLIGHYIEEPKVIAAYNADPDTDFHAKVAEWCEMPRQPAKSINFMMGYGGGKKKCVQMLRNSTDVSAKIKAEIDDMIARDIITEADGPLIFGRMAESRAENLYNRYHSELPRLKRTSYQAAKVCRQRGYVRNLLGRYRRLPVKFAHHAFNSINQSSAPNIPTQLPAPHLRRNPVR